MEASEADEQLRGPSGPGSEANLVPHAIHLSRTTSADSSQSFRQDDLPGSWAFRAPWKLLAFFCAILFLVWFDNGLFASNGITGCSKNCEDPVGFPTAQGAFDLSKAQLGVLAAIFMVGQMVAAVLLTQLTSFISPFRSIGLGMGIWAIAAAGGGVSAGFWTLLLARAFVGAGEASIITLSAPFVDDVAPKASASFWFGVLSSAPPVGNALGYIFGGAAAVIGWRSCFFVEASLGIPIVLIALLVPDVGLKGPRRRSKGGDLQVGSQKLAAGFRGLWADVTELHRHPVFLLNTYAFAPIQAAVGAFSFWGPKVAAELFHLDSDYANLSLGAVTIICALCGILGGGLMLDLIGASIQSALALQLAASLSGLIFCALALIFVKGSFWAFQTVFGIGLFGLFVATAPLYAVGMWSIPAPQRPAGQAYLVVIMHLLGDVPSPPLVGMIQGQVQNWRISMLAITLYLIISVALYSCSLCYCKKAPDYRRLEQAEESSLLEQ